MIKSTPAYDRTICNQNINLSKIIKRCYFTYFWVQYLRTKNINYADNCNLKGISPNDH